MNHKKLVLLLTYAGSIPFIMLTILFFFPFDLGVYGLPIILKMLVSYTAIILSFMAGSQWGLAINLDKKPRTMLLFFSTVSSIVSWVILCFSFVQSINIFIISVSLLFFLLIAQLVIDMSIVRKNNVIEKWYGMLRVRVTFIVSLCLIFSLFRLLSY